MLVLIADDDRISRIILDRTVRKFGHQVVLAEDGESAWEIFQDSHPDVIISDISMPRMDGLELCRLVRAYDKTDYTYFIFLTALEGKTQLNIGIEAGADDYLTKPLDIDELNVRLKVANRITELHRRLTEQTAELQRLNNLKSEFVSLVSHEFRTPLSSILLSTQFLERYDFTTTPEKRIKHQRRITDSVRSMVELLDDVLLFGKAEAGKLEFNPQPIDMPEFCQEMVEEFQEKAGAAYSIQFTFSGGLYANGFESDKRIMRHILSNLLSNAVKYSPNGGKILLELDYKPESVQLKVSDQGIGIPEEDQISLFESFRRAKNVGNIAGTGLGLSIVKKCVDLHGGLICVDSKIGIGTSFIIRLPTGKALPLPEKDKAMGQIKLCQKY
jgi:signal transduction histidine kinase